MTVGELKALLANVPDDAAIILRDDQFMTDMQALDVEVNRFGGGVRPAGGLQVKYEVRITFRLEELMRELASGLVRLMAHKTR